MAEYLMENMWITWLIVGGIFLLIELCTTALISIWFVAGALVSSGVACFSDNLPIQIVIFFVVSGVLLFSFKKLYRNKIKGTLVDTVPGSNLIGKIALVEEKVTENSGRVLVGDVYWKAEADGESFEKGEEVYVKDVSGTKLTVGKK